MTKSKLRRTISGWANPANQEAHRLRQEYARSERSEHLSIADAPDRERVKLRGSLRTVTLRPRAGVPALEAELDDGSGVITIVWLGRRRIAGITPGRAIEVEGRIGAHEGTRVMYNPRYELMP
ncbi:MAG TPA: OB-fold nucleic acid binding domain-containing protein [Nocardioides sp.]|nr:OB-fold nucleic acid binding domain-containing protein [Nocardioides sp.]